MIRIQKNINYEIINLLNDSKSQYPKLYCHLQKLEPLAVLDLGCRVPENLFVLYHEFKCKLLQGVDKSDEETCVKHYRNHIMNTCPLSTDDKLVLKQAETFYDIYKWRIKDGGYEIPKIDNIHEFNKIFVEKFNPPKYLINFFEENTVKYHLIIASNILHFYNDEMDYYLRHIKGALYNEGLLIIRVQDKENFGSPFNYKNFCELLEQHFGNGEIYEYYEGNSWSHAIYINISNLIQN